MISTVVTKVQEILADIDSMLDNSHEMSATGQLLCSNSSGESDDDALALHLTQLQKHFQKLVLRVDSRESQYLDSPQLTFVEKLDTFISVTLNMIHDILNDEDDHSLLHNCLIDVIAELVQLLNSNFVTKLFQPQELGQTVLKPICVRHFTDILITLLNQSCDMPNRNNSANENFMNKSAISDITKHVSQDFELILLLPLLKMLGKLILLHSESSMDSLLDQKLLPIMFDVTVVRNPKRFGLILKMSLELFHEQAVHTLTMSEKFHSNFMTWIRNSNFGTRNVLPYLLVYTEYNCAHISLLQLNNLLEEDFITAIRESLVDKNLLLRKQGLFILKSLTSSVRLSEEIFPISELMVTKLELLMLVSIREDFALFWSTFFELLEIFDEKQIHIIEPCLSKLATFETAMDVNPALVLPWYFILLTKLCQHDNRFLASQGILHFLQSVPKLFNEPTCKENGNGQERELCKNFISRTIFPLLKEKVGWIFPDCPPYFKCAKQLGSFLALMEANAYKNIQLIMHFINTGNQAKVMSPNSLFFLTTTLCHAIKEESCTNSSAAATQPGLPLQDLTLCIASFSHYLSAGLSTFDRFLKTETQKQLIEIFCILLEKAMELTDFSTLMELTRYQEGCYQKILEPLLRFIGIIDYNLFCESSSLMKLCKHLGTCAFSNENENQLTLCTNLNSVEVDGYLRLYFCYTKNVSRDEAVENQYDDVGQFRAQLVNSLEKCCPGIEDLLNCVIYSTYKAENHDEDHKYGEEFISWIIGNTCQKIMDLMELANSKGNFDAKFDVLVKTSLNLLEIIAYNVPEIIMPKIRLSSEVALAKLNGVLAEMLSKKNGPEVLEEVETIYYKKFQLRLIVIFQKIGFTSPELWYLPTYSVCNLFKLINNEHDADKFKQDRAISGTFKTEYHQIRLKAFTQILLRSENEISEYFESPEAQNEFFMTWDSLLDLVDESGPQGIIPLLDFASALIQCQTLPNEDIIYEKLANQIRKFAQISWTRVFEMRKTEAFWIGVEKYLQFIRKPSFSEIAPEHLSEISKDIFEKSERIVGLSLVLMSQISEININELVEMEKHNLGDIIVICTQATYFGPLLSENIRSTYGIWHYLKQVENGELEANDYLRNYEVKLGPTSFNADVKTRLFGILLIIKILTILKAKNTQSYTSTLKMVTLKLLDQNDAESKNKNRYFSSSLTHRIKQRICQALLMFQPYFDEELAHTVTSRLLKSLTKDNPQPSVRYFMEWIIIKNLIHFPANRSIDEFFRISNECCNTRVGFGAFLASICLHVTMNLEDRIASKYFCAKSLQALSVLLMGSHATVRLFAQTCFRKIYKHYLNSSPDFKEITEKFEIVYESLEEFLCMSNEANSFMYQKLESNFYIHIFNPVTDYCVETIFIALPEVSIMSSDELAISSDLTDMLRWCKLNECDCPSNPAMLNKYRDYDQQASWHLKSTTRSGREMGEEVATTNEIVEDLVDTNPETSQVYQKKINPWKYLPISPELSDFSEELQSKKTKCMGDGLILVASLLEKLPNLGGLCRTSEIFGVSKYVISSLKFIHDQTFQNLSVSSEKWVNVIEVSKNTLPSFLATYSSKGYVILGIEQASESIPLNNFKFPRKSILLLGHEKFGIPPELLQLVDQCLEIPQVGITRSLNVHVTGALCIWQYASQHSF